MNNSYYDRLINLFTVVMWHHTTQLEDKNAPTKLNGISRYFNMDKWDCGTSACAYGSYAQSKLVDREHFVFRRMYSRTNHSDKSVYYIGTVEDDQDLGLSVMESAATHFGITCEESEWLFDPETYLFDEHDDKEDAVAQYGTEILPIHVLDRILRVIQDNYPDYEHPVLPPEIHTADFKRTSRPVAGSST